MSTTPSNIHYLQFVEACIATLAIIALTAYHTKTTYWQFQNDATFILKFSSLICWSFVVLSFAISFGLFGIIHGLYLHILMIGMTFTYCHIMIYAISILYGGFKTMSYIALVIRLMASYKDSSISYSNTFYYIWLSFIIICGLSIVFMGIFGNEFYWIADIRKCQVDIPIFVIAAVLLLDFFVCGVNLYLFLRPLCILSKIIAKQSSIDDSLKLIIRKNAVLGSISMVATIITWLIIAASQGKYVYIWQMMDCIITSICIVLLMKYNKTMFQILCCCVSKWVHGKTETERFASNVKMGMSATSNATSNAITNETVSNETISKYTSNETISKCTSNETISKCTS